MKNDEQMPERIWLDTESYNGAVGFAHPEKHKKDGWPGYLRFDLIPDLCASGQQVRALEWKHKPVQNPDFYIETARWDGLIYEACSGGAWWLNGQHHYPAGPDAQNIDAAKAAAQADYERRVLAPLTPAPQPEGKQVRLHGDFAVFNFRREV